MSEEIIVLPENLIGFKYEDKVDPSDTTPPIVWVKKINQLGIVTVAFSEYMFAPNYLEIASREFPDINRRELASDENGEAYDEM